MLAAVEGDEIEPKKNPVGMVSVEININWEYTLMEIKVPVKAEELRQYGYSH